MSIQEHLNKIRNAVYGREVRESIAKGIETAYDDASENGNANMEVKIARGTHPNLRSRLEEVDNKQQQTTTQLAQTEINKADKTETVNLQGQINDLVLGAVGDGNNAEVVQARDGHTVLNERLNAMDETINNSHTIYDLIENSSKILIKENNGGTVSGNQLSVEPGRSGGGSFIKYVKDISQSYVGSRIKFSIQVQVDNQSVADDSSSYFQSRISTKRGSAESTDVSTLNGKRETLGSNRFRMSFEYVVVGGETELQPNLFINSSIGDHTGYTITVEKANFEIISTPVDTTPSSVHLNDDIYSTQKTIEGIYENSRFIYDLIENSSEIREYMVRGATRSNHVITIKEGETGNASVLKYCKPIIDMFTGAEIEFKVRLNTNNELFRGNDSFLFQLDVVKNGVVHENVPIDYGARKIKENNQIEITFKYVVEPGDTELQPLIRISNNKILTMVTHLEIESLTYEVLSYPQGISQRTLDLNDMLSAKTVNTLLGTIIVAANNSSEKDKLLADYVCDGVNDEVELQQALDELDRRSGRLLLADGDYYIDSWNDSYGTEAEVEKHGLFGLIIKETNYQRIVKIEGFGMSMRQREPRNYTLVNSATIHLTEAGYEALGTKKGTLIGGLPNLTSGVEPYPSRAVYVTNIGIDIPDNQKPITLLSGYHFSQFEVEGVYGSIAQPLENINNTPHLGCIGIEGMQTAKFGSGYFMRNCLMFGMGIGFSVGGEHLIMEQCTARYCYYPYAFTQYENGNGGHPITLINCCGELCKQSFLFGDNYKEQTITMIDYNMEYSDDGEWSQDGFAKEVVKGQTRGTIEYTVTAPDTVGFRNQSDIPFWEEGHGFNVKTVNTHDLTKGNTAQRPPLPNLQQKYWDESINKEVTFIDGVWVDAMGNEV